MARKFSDSSHQQPFNFVEKYDLDIWYMINGDTNWKRIDSNRNFLFRYLFDNIERKMATNESNIFYKFKSITFESVECSFPKAFVTLIIYYYY